MSGDEAEENAVVNNVRENENNAVITVQDGDAPVNQAQFKVLFDSIQALSRSTETLKGQFFAFKDDSTEQVAKKAKMDTKSYDFKKKGNDNQFRFTKEIEGCFDDIERELGRISGAEGRSATALEKAKESLKKGQQKVVERQKLIKLADRSEHGWGVVAEYITDELAENSDDEKRMLKAEKAAERKASKRKQARTGVRSTRSNAAQKMPMPQAPQWLQTRPKFVSTPPSSIVPPIPMSSRQVGPCFACGQLGHLRANCNKTVGAAKYPCENTCKEGGNGCNCPQYTGTNCVNEGCRYCVNNVDEYEVDSYVNDAQELSDPRCWEVDSCNTAVVKVKGRLRKSYKFWEEVLQAPQSPVLEMIDKGYILPLLSQPKAYKRPNHKSAFVNAEFTNRAVSELIETGCVKLCREVPLVCSPLVVVANPTSGKKRLVINLKYLNKYIWKEKFKYEDIRTALMYFERGEYIVTFDLKSGYHHIDIHENSQTYLGFEWNNKYYVFTVLPFGLSSACYIFTKLLRPLIKYWRSQGIKAIIYLDDGIASVAQFEKAVKTSLAMRSSLEQAGFVLHPTKCKWEPSHYAQWLGYNIDLHKGFISIPTEKVDKLKLQVKEALVLKILSARAIASIIGKLISMGLGIGPISRLMTRGLYTVLNQCCYWSENISLSSDAIAELEFWYGHIDEFNGQTIWRAPSSVRVVYSDASNTGYGGYIVEHGRHVAHGQWDSLEASRSSTWRELKAVSLCLASVAHKLANNTVKWFTDNKNVPHILTVGSKNTDLQAIALEVFSLSRRYSIRLEPEWTPREENITADYLSRIVDLDDWMLNPEVFNLLDQLWGPHSVDRFANNYNNQVSRFNSRYWNPGSEAVDCFTVNWAGENNWWCPPVGIVLRLLRHAEVCNCAGTLIIPEWPSATFWPVLCPEGAFASFVKGLVYLPLKSDLFIPCKSGAVLFNGLVPNTNVIAIRIDFSKV